MVEAERKSSDGQNNRITRKSSWLQSTLSELDKKTESMLKVIEEDADSFAKRAEMYYKKRPELINLIKDFYRTHRSLAIRYDQASKFSSGSHHLTKSQTSHLITDMDKSCDGYSESFDCEHEDSGKPEFEDPENEVIDHQLRAEVSSSEAVNDKVVSLREDVERLREENKVQKELLVQKDEEKREAIRQLSLCVALLKQENQNLKEDC